ncbi:hypothetical protein [Nakamurella sp. PAMC28650]|uniref:hypothetical protein n=1 Tax=Nakamurella sp. PAMC28650 TaxID=2762325 RepID=UPI00164D4875|nr:hypothetical protein [Nakamurella sp. PAMC28650]QNK81610.1 hypothetical protein H7F38_01880 [Nakamurella sp. PAMC28650]
MKPTARNQPHGATVGRRIVDDGFIDCEICGESHPGGSDCPWELFAAGLGSSPRTGGAADNLTPDDVEYRRPVQPSHNGRMPRPRAELDRDAEPVRENVTRLVERLDTIIRYGIPAIPEIVASAEDLVDGAPPDGNESAAEELRCIAEDLLGLASTLPDVAGRLCRLADAMEKT